MRLWPVDFLGKAILCASTFVNSNNQISQANENTEQPATQASSAKETEPVTSKNISSENPLFSTERLTPSQINGRWCIPYELTYNKKDKPFFVFNPQNLKIKYDSWVANSALPKHSVARRSQAEWNITERNPIITNVIPSLNEGQRCCEKILVVCLPEGLKDSVYEALNSDKDLYQSLSGIRYQELTLQYGQRVYLYLLLDHDHFLYGTYDPLLGTRDIEISYKKETPYTQIAQTFLQEEEHEQQDEYPYTLLFKDEIKELEQELNPAQPEVKLSTPVNERMDTRQFRSAPDSLYIAADIPGYQYFRFDDMRIKRGTRFNVSFWYLIAVGTEGTCHARIMEYQDTPNAWYRLEGGFDEQLPLHGRWQKFGQKTFTALDDTTTIALDFRIIGANVGEMWIDDLELVPIYKDNEEGSRKEKFFRPNSQAYQPSFSGAKASRKKALVK